MSAAFLWLCLFIFIGQQPHARYFKEDHLTGADYIWLAADHNRVPVASFIVVRPQGSS